MRLWVGASWRSTARSRPFARFARLAVRGPTPKRWISAHSAVGACATRGQTLAKEGGTRGEEAGERGADEGEGRSAAGDAGAERPDDPEQPGGAEQGQQFGHLGARAGTRLERGLIAGVHLQAHRRAGIGQRLVVKVGIVLPTV